MRCGFEGFAFDDGTFAETHRAIVVDLATQWGTDDGKCRLVAQETHTDAVLDTAEQRKTLNVVVVAIHALLSKMVVAGYGQGDVPIVDAQLQAGARADLPDPIELSAEARSESRG